MTNEKIEKIEVAKSNGIFYFTGVLKNDPNDEELVIINTTRGEELKFRKEQIQQRRKIDDMKEDDTDERREDNKSSKYWKGNN